MLMRYITFGRITEIIFLSQRGCFVRVNALAGCVGAGQAVSLVPMMKSHSDVFCVKNPFEVQHRGEATPRMRFWEILFWPSRWAWGGGWSC